MGEEKRLGRVGQFLRAIRARISSEDLAFMEAHLPKEARPLFLAMHPPYFWPCTLPTSAMC